MQHQTQGHATQFICIFSFLFNGDGRVERGFVQLAHRLILYVCRHLSSVLCASPLDSTQQQLKRHERPSLCVCVENYSTATATGLECQRRHIEMGTLRFSLEGRYVSCITINRSSVNDRGTYARRLTTSALSAAARTRLAGRYVQPRIGWLNSSLV